MKRKNKLVIEQYYHVFNKSIAGYKIFNNNSEYNRIILSSRYYQANSTKYCFSEFMRSKIVEKKGFSDGLKSAHEGKDKLVRIVAFCIMPTHVHFVLQQLMDNGISIFMGNVLNSYARYFNRKYKRLGPLWAGRFKEVLVDTDEQLWHLSRYVHLNPTTAGLVKKPQKWLYSSYLEYLDMVTEEERISQWEDVIDMTPDEYREFVDDRIDYQKNLAIIKHLMLD